MQQWPRKVPGMYSLIYIVKYFSFYCLCLLCLFGGCVHFVGYMFISLEFSVNFVFFGNKQRQVFFLYSCQ